MEIFELIYDNIFKTLALSVVLYFCLKTILTIMKSQLAKSEANKKSAEYNSIFIETVEKRLEIELDADNTSKNENKKQWYYSMAAEAASLEATVAGHMLKMKKRPAHSKAAEIEGPIKDKLRALVRENAKLRLELKIFDEHFPQYAEIREHILDSEEALFETSEEGDKIDRARKFISTSEYERLDPTKRNQLALERYISRNHSQQEIGRFYERYLGYLWETAGWDVQFKGLVDGFEDLGRDLICKKAGVVEIVQAKNWSSQKTIHEKHIYQLFATKTHYCLSNNLNKKQQEKVTAIFATTTQLSTMAKEVAKYLKVEIKNIPLQKDYPMIKCNMNPANQTKIYHLPFDQQYDKIKVGDQKGECYVLNVAEAEKMGFRRAFRWRSGAGE